MGAQHRAGDAGIGAAGDLDVLQIIVDPETFEEAAPQSAFAGAAGGDQRAVDIEEEERLFQSGGRLAVGGKPRKRAELRIAEAAGCIQPAGMDSTKEQRMWAMIAHLSAFAYYITGIGHILGPLIVWLSKREGNPFIDDQAKEALNFQISVTLYGIVGVLLCMTVILAIVGIPALIALHGFQIVCIIIAAIKANDGVAFRYPLCIRFIK